MQATGNDSAWKMIYGSFAKKDELDVDFPDTFQKYMEKDHLIIW